MALTVSPHVWLDGKGTAWIDDTNVKVIEVALDWLTHGSSPEEMHLQYPHLSLGQIHAALAHYYDHHDEFDAQIARNHEEVRALKAQAGESPASKKLRALGHL